MEKTTTHPDSVLDALLAKSQRSHKVANLKALHEVCRAEHLQQKYVAKDFSIAYIGRLCENKGIFKARTLYNSAASDYVDLIRAWAAYSGPMAVKISAKAPKAPSGSEFLMRITDPSIRSIFQATIAERDKLRQQLDIMKANTAITIDLRPIPENVTNEMTMEVLPPTLRLTQSERLALEEAISSCFMKDQAWTIGGMGEVSTEKGRTLYSPGYVSAISKVLKEL
ncbi:alpha/beta hydrolase [Duganella sp. FT135W]|uniref:Alpha/beta hydrolase n=1 Tax=Duganella flavida TaxID=2692175 RepID=A0A6L8KHA7_9BURK|nr:gamma-mobile-trio protein GmtX [Duganella flavida]MYM26495.1 alpha/beta hydrolase [Duganella flavida]